MDMKMLPVIIYIFFILVFIFVDFNLVFKNQQLKLMLVYCAITIITVAVLFLNAAGFDVPSPAKPIEKIVNSILKQ